MKTKDMTDEQMRVAIAEACGWTRFPWKEGVREPEGMKDSWVAPGYNKMGNMDEYITMIEHTRKLPDYLNDLNAMAEALAILTPDQRNQFLRELQIVVDDNIHGGWFWACVNATSRQRALAFVATMQKP